VSRVAVLAAAALPSPHRFPCAPLFSPLPSAPVPSFSKLLLQLKPALAALLQQANLGASEP